MRDYANKKRRSSSARPFLVLLATIVLIGVGISFPVLMIYKHHQHDKKNLAKNKMDPKTLAEKPKDPSQQFDFYTLLPKMAVPNSEKNP